jgi:aspartyl/glutamyl-tRNA(Asn/Gln) amidotransferase C subunit
MSEPPPETAEIPLPDPEALVRRLGKLSRLDLAAEEVRATAPHLERILKAFEKLKKAELEPLSSPTPEVGGGLREDGEKPSLAPNELLRNAPEPSDGFYAVPKTIGGLS